MALHNSNLPVLDRIVPRLQLVASSSEAEVVEHKLLIQDEESVGYNPYDNPGPALPTDKE